MNEEKILELCRYGITHKDLFAALEKDSEVGMNQPGMDLELKLTIQRLVDQGRLCYIRHKISAAGESSIFYIHSDSLVEYDNF